MYTTNQLERLAKEIKRRIKVIEVFSDEVSVERLLYLILKEMNERLNSRRLRGFNEIELGTYHALPKKNFYTIKGYYVKFKKIYENLKNI
uniref:transposase n=1 Tax=Thermodesulfobacterium geofontis TaxID=1295609 RepID=UPI0009D6BE89